MLNDATCFQAVYIVCGYTDLRFGMDRLAAVIETKTGNSPYVPGTLYLFCGRRSDRIKGLVWEGDGWLLLYKRLSESQFQWPRNAELLETQRDIQCVHHLLVRRRSSQLENVDRREEGQVGWQVNYLVRHLRVLLRLPSAYYG